jgi:3-(3-hydroxy-phenyl)propionate hydroxylase
MRPAGKGPLESLYFNYPSFPPIPAPEQHGKSLIHPVVIVGGGPIGMTAALTLAQYGVKSVILEKKDTFNDGSRATCIARPSMTIFERIGAVEPFLKKALGWQFGRSYFRDEQIFRLEMPHPAHEKYLPMYNLQQQYIEQYLHDAIASNPLIEMRWHSDVIGLQNEESHVTISVSHPLGSYAMKADYVLAADGARSPLRSMLGLRLRGENYEGKYVIADVRMEHDFPTERRAFFEPAGNPGGTVLVHKQPDNIWRIDYQLKSGESEEEALKEENIRTRVEAILRDLKHDGTYELEWWSIYSANTLCLDEYKHGRVIFIGDSAHIVPIFGVRGLNNGLADAHNIGWKLGLVLNGEAEPKLLDSYTPERRGATLDVFANASKSTRFMTPPTRGWRLAREAALSLSLRHDFPKGLANPRQMQPFTYVESPLTLHPERDHDFQAGPSSGAAAPNARLADGSYLLDHAGDGYTILFFVVDKQVPNFNDLIDQMTLLHKRFKPLFIKLGTSEADDVYEASAGTIYLLRPDLHIAGRWKRMESLEIINCLKAGLGRDGGNQ